MKLIKRTSPVLSRRTLRRSSRAENENEENEHDNLSPSPSSSDDESSADSGESDCEGDDSKLQLPSPRKTRSCSQSQGSQGQSVLSTLSRNRDADNRSEVSNRTSISRASRNATSSERNGAPMSPDVEMNDSDWSPANGFVLNGTVRRSTRMRTSKFDTLNQSWILGGGGGALGYPTGVKRKASNELALAEEAGENNEEGNNEQPESEDEDVHDDPNGDTSGDDMYGRVKDPRRRRSSRRIVNYREGRNRDRSNSMELDVEPVSRRLRDRTHVRKLTKTHSERSNHNEFSKRHSQLSGRRRRRRRRIVASGSSSSSSDSEDYCVGPAQRRKDKEKERNVSKKNFMGDVQPLALDSSISFESVGGLESYVDKLKEIVIFPLMYKEFFSSRGITPPRGILFYGPPGTGKTLLARALASECSEIAGKTVSFFMRKGADILCKWVGESERQLKLLFEQASIHQPSIIFFDELDGLAPVRSSKTDQVHNSIVSTLLAELDGVKDRGDIIVIGATNRVDSIDPALRRPGRFDHEFPFFLPAQEARKSILNVHLKDWKDSPVDENFVSKLADLTAGYSGADLRLLCGEANMCALRRRYPQIYSSKQKLVLNYSSVQVERRDWEMAMTIISRSSDRSIFSSAYTGAPLPQALQILLSKSVKTICERLNRIFPYRSAIMKEVSRKSLLVYEEPDSIEVSEHILPAVLHTMDTVPVYTLSIQTLALNEPDGKGVAMLFGEATKRSFISTIFIPNIEKVFDVLGNSGQQVLLSELYKASFSPVLILASVTKKMLPEELRPFFEERMNLPKISKEELKEFFTPIFYYNAMQVKWVGGGVNALLEELPVAPPEVKVWTKAEIAAIEKTENRTLVQLKIFLRDTIHKLARNKKFVEFTKPVNVEEVPDYLDIVTHPMDLETMMCKVNQGVYMSRKDFADDIELIVSNALNYNPAKTDTDLRIRHRAFELKDVVAIELEEMDTDFEEDCRKIKKAREKRSKLVETEDGFTESSQDVQEASQVSSQPERESRSESRSPMVSPRLHRLKRRRTSAWSKGITPTPKKFSKKIPPLDSQNSSISFSVPASPAGTAISCASEDVPLAELSNRKESSKSPAKSPPLRPKSPVSGTKLEEKPDEFGFVISNKFHLYRTDLDLLVEGATSVAFASCNIRQTLDLKFQLLRVTEAHNETHDKKECLKEMKHIIDKARERIEGRKRSS